MKINVNGVELPFKVGEVVFVDESLHYWENNNKKQVRYFSGIIKSIEICLDPKSRFIKQANQDQCDLIIDILKYEVLPQGQYNPFGQVQIFEHIGKGKKLFRSEGELLNSTTIL